MRRRAFGSLILKVSGNVNADMGLGTRIPLKKIITWDQQVKPFVSARCVKRCIRERLSEKGFEVDPLQLVGEREARQLGDIGNPIKYVDDDLFGFLLPQEMPIRRSGPVKVSHLISLHHAEIRVEFAARFPREFLEEYQKEYPAPFEIELAEWLGRLNVIISDRIGRFSKDELTEEAIKELGGLSLPSEERKRRLKGLLEVLFWEGWEFPRGGQNPCVPEYYYGIIALTDRFVPIFGYLDVDEENKLNQVGINAIIGLYGKLIDKLFIFKYREHKYSTYEKEKETLVKREEDSELDATKLDEIINTICEHVVH